MYRQIMSIIEQGYRDELSVDEVTKRLHQEGFTICWNVVADVYCDIEYAEEGK